MNLYEAIKSNTKTFEDFEDDYLKKHKIFTSKELITWLIKLPKLEKFIKDSFQGIGVTFEYNTFEDEEPPYVDVCVQLDSKPSKESLDVFLKGFEDFCKTNKLDVNPVYSGSYFDDTSAVLYFSVLYGGDYFEFGDIVDKSTSDESTSDESKSASPMDELKDFIRYSSLDADFVEESSSDFGTHLTFDISGEFDSNRTLAEEKSLFKEVESFYKELVDFLKLHHFDAKATYLADDPSMPDMFVIDVRDGGNYFDLTFDGNNFSKKSKYSTK